MATKREMQSLLDKMVEKLNELGPYVLDDWGGSIQFIFPDLHTGWILKMAMAGTVEFCEEKIDKKFATGVVEMESDILVGIMNKTLPLMEALAEGKIKVRKSQEALVKIMMPVISWL